MSGGGNFDRDRDRDGDGNRLWQNGTAADGA